MELEKKIDHQIELLNSNKPKLQNSSGESSMTDESNHITVLRQGQQQLSPRS
jgi:hypothetical protein